MSALAILALSWARPGNAWALLLPLLFLVLVRAFARPPSVVIGTLSVWKEVQGPSPRSGARRARIPPWAWCLAGSLLVGALGLVGPRGARAATPRTWTLVLDASPSTSLAVYGGGPTRQESALESALAWWEEHAGKEDRLRWLSSGREPLELGRGERPPWTWLSGGPGFSPEPAWKLHDEPGTLWVSDRVPEVAREHAGLFTSGGPAVPGPIAADGRETVRWDGERLLREPPGERRAVVLERALDRSELPPVLLRAARAWSEARGFELAKEPRTNAVLVLEAEPAGGESVRVEVARDGWRAVGLAPRAGAAALEGAREDWLVGETEAGASIVLVRARNGRVRVALRELSEPDGDPAAFALSWGRLCDRRALPAPGVVPLAERIEAGEPVLSPGERPESTALHGPDLGPYLDALLALSSAVLGAAGLAGMRGPAGPGPAPARFTRSALPEPTSPVRAGAGPGRAAPR